MSKYLSVKAGIIENNHFLTVDIDTWYFLDWDLTSDKYKIITNLLPFHHSMLCWIQKINKYQNSFYFLQRNTKQVIEYNQKTDEVLRYGKEYIIGDNSNLMYCDAFLLDKKLYMFPYKVDGSISIFDTETKMFEKDYVLRNLCTVDENVKDSRILSYHQMNNYVWFCIEKSNIVMCIDLLTMKISRFDIDEAMSFEYIVGNKNKIWIMEKGGQRISECSVFKDALKYESQRNCEMFSDDCDLFYPIDDCFVGYSEEKKTLQIIDNCKIKCKTFLLPDNIKNIYELRMSDLLFSKGIFDTNKIYLLPLSGNSLVEIDLDNMELKCHFMLINGMDVAYSSLKKGEVIWEKDNFSLGDFLLLIDRLDNKMLIEKRNNSRNKENIYF